MRTKKLQLSLIFSISIMLLSTVNLSLADDYVNIKIQMTGDAYVTISNSNGSITFTYNGLNVLPHVKNEIRWLQTRANSNKLAIYLVRRDLKRLVVALNKTFNDLYGKVYYLAHITGIYNGNDNSTVTLMLKGGNMTLVDFIDQLLNTTEKQDMQITNLSLEVASNQQETREKLNKAFQEIYMNRAYIEDQLKILDEKINALSNKTNSTFTQIFNDLELLKMYEASNARSTQIALTCIGVLNIIMVALIVWIAGWKAEKIKQQQ